MFYPFRGGKYRNARNKPFIALYPFFLNRFKAAYFLFQPGVPGGLEGSQS
jgi:hypothetical protein